MAAPHTQGPWAVNEADGSIIYSVKTEDAVALYGQGADDDDAAFSDSEDERFANACLIAAAPDLLDLLTLALPYVETAADDPAFKPGLVNALAQRIRAAIAKATGDEA